MAFCVKCGAAVAEGVSFCGSCGAPVAGSAAGAPGGFGQGTAPAAGAGGLTSNVAGMLAYFTFIPALIFLLVEPYNKDRFVRFHAFQSLFFTVGWIVVWIAAIIVGIPLGFLPAVGWMMAMALHTVIGLGLLILWVILVLKAYQNQQFRLPIIGDMAANMAAQH